MPNLWCFLFLFVKIASCQDLTSLLITQPWEYELTYVERFEKTAKNEVNNTILKTHLDFDGYIGSWGIWSILRKLHEKSHTSDWIFIAEPFTSVNWEKLKELIRELDPNEEHFMGRALIDQEPVIIHHYYGFQDSDDRIVYPDFAAGVLLSRGALKRIANEAASHDKNDFTIDAKFEFAKFVSETTGIVLKNVPKFCLLPTEVDCITHYEEPKYFPDEIGCGPGITNQNVYYAVKTFSGYHKTRVVYVKRTWAKQAKYVDFFSDTNETQIPSIDLGVENVKIGHCQKTISIMKYFLEQAELKHINWIVIADDDTLLNVEQLQRVINCLPTSNRAILGERYGFGFEWDGISGYDYPTGGSGFVMSRETARILAFSCECPSIDSPDDMIIGMCSRRLSIPILHSAAFHQTQRRDYNPLYIQRITPISFHKLENLDPYKEYNDHLMPKSNQHVEL